MEAVVEFLRSFGSAGLFVHALIDAVFFPIPAFFLQISLSALQPENALWLATVGYIGCLLGTPIGYALGKSSGQLILSRWMKKERLASAEALFRRHGEAAILFGSFTPIPFKLFTIMSGIMKYPLWKLLVYAAIGRAAKFYVVGFLFYVYGRTAEQMVDQVLGIVMLAIGLAVAGGWLLVRKVRQRRKAKAEAVSLEK